MTPQNRHGFSASKSISMRAGEICPVFNRIRGNMSRKTLGKPGIKIPLQLQGFALYQEPGHEKSPVFHAFDCKPDLKKVKTCAMRK
ncbi:hypothetical protein [Agrobacterium vitis]|uniref:hypothetical protein n=1 Tax=Agrobacterium vitis TaxID=373 RepID=UPI003D2E6158